jgi:hypothetical protein
MKLVKVMLTAYIILSIAGFIGGGLFAFIYIVPTMV